MKTNTQPPGVPCIAWLAISFFRVIVTNNTGDIEIKKRSLLNRVEVEKFIAVEDKFSEMLNTIHIFSEEIDRWSPIIQKVKIGDKASRLQLLKKLISSMGIYVKYWFFVHIMGFLILVLMWIMKVMGYPLANDQDHPHLENNL